MNTELLEQIIERIRSCDPLGREAVSQLVQRATAHFAWSPNPGPQSQAFACEADELFYGGQAGGGKLQSMDSKVLTPFGWVDIGTLKIGSKLCATDSTVTEVMGVHPQGKVDLYRVTMADGGSTEAGLDHNWLAWETHATRKIANKIIAGSSSAAKYTTAEIMAAMRVPRRNGERRRFAIPLCEPVALNVAGSLVGRGNFVGRPIDPYLLGLLIGDGSFTSAKRITITSADEEIFRSVRHLAGNGVAVDAPPNRAKSARLRGAFLLETLKALKDLKLLGHHSETKFIPRQYLFGPVDVRWALIQGLMDTDGWVEAKRACYYTTVSSKLADDVKHLAHSLGAMVTVTEKAPSYSHKGERRKGLKACCLRIRIAQPQELFRLTRKREIASRIKHQSNGRFIAKIEFSRSAQAVCIKVRHRNSLYITDDFIVTHNTDLGLGLALTAHKRSLILRRINKDAVKLVERVAAILGHRDGYNGQLQRWKLGDRLIEFSGCEHEDDKHRFKGDPHDLIYFDEGTDFLHSQYRFIIGWNRSADPDLHCRVVVGSNPPTTPEGLWVIKHWAPWLDPLHPHPAKAGEIRWFTTGEDGEDLEVDHRGPHLLRGETVFARSRTYLPARLSDNPDLAETGYAAVLAGLPEELRRAYRDGDFGAGLKDHEFQVIPTEWIEAAQGRWRGNAARQPMTAIGVDVAQGGDDQTVVAARHGGWYARVVRKPGKDTREGSDVARMVVGLRHNNCPVIIDVGGGWGAAAVGALERNGIPVVAFNGVNPSAAATREGRLRFYNKRAEGWWRFREELDPDQEFGSVIALPPDASIKADLAAPRWELTPRGVKIEDKDAIRKRLGRSPDDGDAIVMCLNEGARAAARQLGAQRHAERPERANVGYAHMKQMFWR